MSKNAANERDLSVGFNLLSLGPRGGGIGRYVSELIPALIEVEPTLRLTAFVGRHPPPELLQAPWAAEVEWVRLPVSPGGLQFHLLVQTVALPRLARRRGIDVLHSPANVGALSRVIPSVLTLHDLVWFHHPHEWETRVRAKAMRVLAVRCARVASRVVTDSAASRDDFIRTIGLEEERIDVAPLGVRASEGPGLSETQLRQKLDLGPRPYILCVSQKRPYKNQEALVRALPELVGVDLVLPGASTEYEQRLRDIAHELGVADRLHTPNWVNDAELDSLYRHAVCFCLPSLFEGFGMPVLEAMARGVPVACSDAWSLPEVAGDAALFFDPRDQAAVTSALKRLLEDAALAADLISRGLARAREFTWQRTARLTAQTYRRAAKSPPRRAPATGG